MSDQSSNGCPVCFGLGRIIAFGVALQPITLICPECAGLAITPASADDAQVGDQLDDGPDLAIAG